MKIQTRRSNTATRAISAVVAGAIFGLTINPANATIPPNERVVLDAFYVQTGSNAALASGGWEGPVGTECSWLGITCFPGDEDHVGAIVLPSLGLTGTLPNISLLNRLQIFDVSDNRLGGTLPALSAIFTLQSFNASQNAFTGAIPALPELRQLKLFNVESNQLDGNAPDLASLSALRVFRVGNNQLTGTVPNPPDLGVLTTAGSSLCPNSLVPASTPESAVDLIWDSATGNTPWSVGCSGAPVVIAAAVPAPALGAASLLLLIGLCGVGGGLFARYRVA